MYQSMEARMKSFRKEKNAQQVNDEKTQIRLYKDLAQKAEKEEQASNIANLLMGVVSNVDKTIGEELKKTVPSESGSSSILVKIANSLTDGKFSQLYKSMSSVPDSELSEQAKRVKAAMNEQETKDAINERIRQEMNLKKLAERSKKTQSLKEQIEKSGFKFYPGLQSGPQPQSYDKVKDLAEIIKAEIKKRADLDAADAEAALEELRNKMPQAGPDTLIPDTLSFVDTPDAYGNKDLNNRTRCVR